MAKKITIQEALEMVHSGDEIVTGLAGSEARAILSELHTIADRIEKPVEVTNCLPMVDYHFQEEQYKDKFFVNGWFYSPAIRKMHNQGNASFIPNHLHMAATDRIDHKIPRFYMGACSAVDEHGYVSLSLGNTYEKEMMDNVEITILEVNPNFPRTFGDVQVHVDDIDYIVDVDYQMPVLPSV